MTNVYHGPSSAELSAGRPVSPVFSVAHPEASEVIVDNHRILFWVPNGDESPSIAKLAGWESYTHGLVDEETYYIEVPEGTRSASSVLSGTEAWKGEKIEVIDRFARIVEGIATTLRKVDVGASFDTIAVTRSDEREIFLTPPHFLSDDQQVIHEWRHELLTDAEHILANDPNKQDLLERFANGIDAALTSGSGGGHETNS